MPVPCPVIFAEHFLISLTSQENGKFLDFLTFLFYLFFNALVVYPVF